MLRSVNRFDAVFQSRLLKLLSWLAVSAGLAWCVAAWILSGDAKSQELDLLLVGALMVGFSIIRNWRSGVYLLMVWLAFEDFARKFLGNNMFIYFGKDALVAVVCVALFYGMRRRWETGWRPPFWLPLSLFFWWAAIEAFNPASASVKYGLLGLKVYFCYVPLMFVGHALIRTESDLRRFLVFNLALGAIVSLLGIMQAITGQQLLNPEDLDPALRPLGMLNRTAPISGLVFNRPTSVFVSDGRFGAYLILMWVLAFGTVGYLIMRAGRGRKIAYLSSALILAAILLSGVRTAFVYSLFGAAVMLTAMIWGAPFRKEQLLRVFKAIRRLLFFSAAGAICLALLYPSSLASRWAFYTETLSPNSSQSELASRAWKYPISEFAKAFGFEHWLWGRGLGTTSLGTQYVMRLLNAPPPGPGVENGYGQLLLEIGIPGLILWIVMIVAIARTCWGPVNQLRGTPLFPVAFSIFWFTLIVLFPLSFVSLATYQDFIINAYLWMLIGVLFRMPGLPVSPLSEREKRVFTRPPHVFVS
jgi:hypothetical protein